ncbi:hypothetical protein BH10PSE4_BH10PSE4_16520 [soil metagenome]
MWGFRGKRRRRERFRRNLAGALSALAVLAISGPAATAEPFVSGIDPKTYATLTDGAEALKLTLKSHSLAQIDAAAAGGNAEAQYLSGIARMRGVATEPNLVVARDYLRRAALAGFARAQFAYGGVLYRGDGGRKDIDEALGWWEQAKKAGITSAGIQLGSYYRYEAAASLRDEGRAHAYFAEAAKQGDLEAQTELVLETYSGFGVPKDPDAAIPQLKELATRGSIKANAILGGEYRYGAHVAKSPSEAMAYYKRAAALGNFPSTYAVAQMLEVGELGEAQPALAAQFLLAQANREDWASQALLARLLIIKATATPAGLDVEKIALQSLERGYPEGFGALVLSLREGKFGQKQDLARAALLSREGLKIMEALDLSQEGAWPLHAQGAAYTIRRAIEAHAIAAQPGELDRLLNRYGSTTRMKKFNLTVRCGDATGPLTLYLWEVVGNKSPLDDQFAWAEKARDCVIPQDARDRYERLFNKSVATGRAFQDLAIEDLTAEKRAAILPPIVF